MEQALFDGYLRQIRELHPGCSLPALHQSDQLLADADRLRDLRWATRRSSPGSTRAAAGGDDVWGAFLGAGTWTPRRYEAARAASPALASCAGTGELRWPARTSPRTRRRPTHVDLDPG